MASLYGLEGVETPFRASAASSAPSAWASDAGGAASEHLASGGRASVSPSRSRASMLKARGTRGTRDGCTRRDPRAGQRTTSVAAAALRR